MSSNPGLSELIKDAIRYETNNFFVSLPGRIEKYDATQQKAIVKPLINKKLRDGTSVKISSIYDVPVIFPSVSPVSGIKLPISEGTGCLLIFCDRSIDYWLSTGVEQDPSDFRRHDLNDCIAIPGLHSFSPQEQLDFGRSDSLTLGHNDGRLEMTRDGRFFIGNNAVSLLDQLISLAETLGSESSLSFASEYRLIALRLRELAQV